MRAASQRASHHADVDLLEQLRLIGRGTESPLRQHGVDRREQRRGGRGRAASVETELTHCSSRKGPDRLDVATALLTTQLVTPATR